MKRLLCPQCDGPKTFYSNRCGDCRRTGDYNPGLRRSLKRRFQEKIEIDHGTGCWLWTGAQDGHSYGQINIDGRPEKSHRLAYRLYIGEIPSSLTIDHLCRVTLCVNPEHLEPVTLSENTRRQFAALGHHPRWGST